MLVIAGFDIMSIDICYLFLFYKWCIVGTLKNARKNKKEC